MAMSGPVVSVTPFAVALPTLTLPVTLSLSLSLSQVFNVDRSNKTVVVEEGMTSSMVCHLLVVKNHFDESPNWVILEQLGDVSLGEWVGQTTPLHHTLTSDPKSESWRTMSRWLMCTAHGPGNTPMSSSSSRMTRNTTSLKTPS